MITPTFMHPSNADPFISLWIPSLCTVVMATITGSIGELAFDATNDVEILVDNGGSAFLASATERSYFTPGIGG